MASCPKCKSTNISFKREYVGTESKTKYFRTAKKSKTSWFVPAGKRQYSSNRKHRTVCLCQNCGHSWYIETHQDKIATIIGLIVLLVIIVAIVRGCGTQRELTTGNEDQSPQYTITESNLALVDNPSQEYVVNALSSINGIYDIECATEGNDPNNGLSKEDGYTSAVFFKYSQIDQTQFNEDSSIEIGTDAGGCVEVYRNVSDAQNRISTLSTFKIAGSHKLIGSVIVRTSSKMDNGQQAELEAMICRKLLGQ